MQKYDAVIVNYNGGKIISECLRSLLSSSAAPSNIVIYDNNSQDDSIKIIKRKFPQVVLIEGKRNIGFGPGNNEAMKRTRSEFILFINNDVILGKKCAGALLEGFEDPKIVIMNPIIYKGWHKKNNSAIYSFGAEMNKSGFNYGLYDAGPDRSDLNSFSGACFMARSKIIKKLKFEKRFFLYYEEPDISVRIMRQKLKIGRTSKAKCYHIENYSSPQKKSDGICFRQYYAIQNHWYILGKYWPTSLLWSAMPLNIIHLIYNIFFFMKNDKFRQTKIIYLSFSNFFIGRKKYKKIHNNLWIRNLADNTLSNIFNLKKKVYR